MRAQLHHGFLSDRRGSARVGARDAFGPLPEENREDSLAPCLSGRRQVQARALQSFEVANRVRHLSLGRAAPPMWDAGSPWSAIFLQAAGRRSLLGRQHSAPGHELVGTWWQRLSLSPRASGRGGGACRRYGGTRPGSRWEPKRKLRRGRSWTANCKEAKGQGRRKGRKEQRSAPHSRPSRGAVVLQLEFRQRCVRRATAGKLMPCWQSSQMHHLPVRQAPGKAVPAGLTRPRRRGWGPG